MTELEEKLKLIADCLPDAPFKAKVIEAHAEAMATIKGLTGERAILRDSAIDMGKAVIRAYALPDGCSIDRVRQSDGTYKWAVRNENYGTCLNASGIYEYEPSPSGRTAEFTTRCRFASAEVAYAAWEASNDQAKGREHSERPA